MLPAFHLTVQLWVVSLSGGWWAVGERVGGFGFGNGWAVIIIALLRL